MVKNRTKESKASMFDNILLTIEITLILSIIVIIFIFGLTPLRLFGIMCGVLAMVANIKRRLIK